jgi:tripartite-type tricarboxylate transporter receptor subunit TctC
VVIENRAGAGGTVGSAAVARASADGYTLLWGGTSSLVVAPALYPGLSYDPVKSFAPVGMVVRGPMMIAGRGSLPAKNLAEVLALAKSQKLSYGSAGAGSIGHLAGELFEESNNLHLLHVPYRGGALALNDLLGGQIDLLFETAQFMAPHIKAGKVIPFGVAGSKRYPGLPDVPTLNELLGKSSFEAYSWFCLVAPANTPKPILMTLEKSLQKTLSDPAIQAQFTASGFETVNSQSDFLAQAIASDLKKWRELVQRRNIKPD